MTSVNLLDKRHFLSCHHILPQKQERAGERPMLIRVPMPSAGCSLTCS
jgi:hypothetical protein